MQDTCKKQAVDVQGVSTPWLSWKFCSWRLGHLALPRSFMKNDRTSARQTDSRPYFSHNSTSNGRMNILCKTIYHARGKSCVIFLFITWKFDVLVTYKDKDKTPWQTKLEGI